MSKGIKVLKRKGFKQDFDIIKIIDVLNKANKKNGEATPEEIKRVAHQVKEEIKDNEISAKDLENIIRKTLIENNLVHLATSYIVGCYEKQAIHHKQDLDSSIMGIIEESNEEVGTENANKNPALLSTQRDYIAGEISKDISKRLLFPKEVIDAHEKGIIHIHDLDYAAMRIHNCELINIEDMLQNGTVISGVKIETPKSLSTAATVMTQISAQVASSSFGGQSINLAHLAPFVEVSRKKIRNSIYDSLDLAGIDDYDDEGVEKIVYKELLKEIKDAVQTMQYQWSTISSTNGQTPFISLFLNLRDAKEGSERDDLALLIKEVFNQRIQGVKNEQGVYINPTFPKLIYVLDEMNIDEDDEYYWLTKLAAKCTAKRMVPDYLSAKKMLELKGDVYSPMGCRSFLTPDPENHHYWGRFNQGVVTINLPHVALSSKGVPEDFWKILEERMEKLIRPALMARHNRLKGTKSDVAPILWQHGALTRLEPGEVIDKYLYDNYSTISVGYAGLYETVLYMTGESHTEESSKKFAKDVLQFLNDKAEQWKNDTRISFSVYGTPIESTTGRLAEALKRDFEEVEGVNDKDFVTNSYHIYVGEDIDAFSKLAKEAVFQELSPGGAISYIEVPDLQTNVPAVLAVMRYIYDTILYAEINGHSDLCEKCGFEGEIELIKNKEGKRVWQCPQCGNKEQKTLYVVRRICGYLGNVSKNGANQARLADIENRVLHLK